MIIMEAPKPSPRPVLYNEETSTFYDLEFSNVDNGGKYPGSFTKKEYSWLSQFSKGKILHLFSGSSQLGDIRVDLANLAATINADVFKYLSQPLDHFDTVILDPPYNQKFAEKYAKLSGTDWRKQFIIFAQTEKTTTLFNRLIELSPQRIILKSWNWYVVKGYYPFKAFVCYAGGYRKPTFFMVMEKLPLQGAH